MNSGMARGLTFAGVPDFDRKYIQDICYTALVTLYGQWRRLRVDRISPEATDNDLAISDVDRFRQGAELLHVQEYGGKSSLT